MDKKGNIGEHSEEKLLVYRHYLENYLYVMTNTKQKYLKYK